MGTTNTFFNNQTGNLSASAVSPAAGAQQLSHVGVYFRLNSAATFGLLFATLRWTEGGAARATILPALDILSLASVQLRDFVYQIARDDQTTITLEATLVGLVGSVSYNLYAQEIN